MTEGDPAEAMRQAARDVLRELLPEMIAELTAPTRPAPSNGHDQGNSNSNSNGNAATAARGAVRAPSADPSIVPLVPTPPVAAVLRPSTWAVPAVPGEVIGDGPASTAAASQPTPLRVPSGARSDGANARVEAVTLDSDADLQRFVSELLRRFENPRQRLALRSGRVRFALRRTGNAQRAGGASVPSAAPAIRIEKGAVTERRVREAAATGARLVLARRAVLTPLARDQARSLHVVIEREDR